MRGLAALIETGTQNLSLISHIAVQDQGRDHVIDRGRRQEIVIDRGRRQETVIDRGRRQETVIDRGRRQETVIDRGQGPDPGTDAIVVAVAVASATVGKENMVFGCQLFPKTNDIRTHAQFQQTQHRS
jgi:hypothetical protein